MIDDESGDWVCPDHGYRVPEGYADQCPDCFLDAADRCPNCCTPWKCNGPHLIEGAEVVLFDKPGTVRWVLPEGKGVAVVFEDGSMYWAYAEHIGEIGGRE